jgi:hypothetical protein
MVGNIDIIRILASSRVLIGITLTIIAYCMISKLYTRNKSRMLIISKFLIGYLWLNIALVITRSFHKNHSTINIRKVAFLLISIVLIYSLYYFTAYINDPRIFNLEGIDEKETNVLKIYGHFVYFTMSVLSNAIGDIAPTTLGIRLMIATQYIMNISIFTILITKAL